MVTVPAASGLPHASAIQLFTPCTSHQATHVGECHRRHRQLYSAAPRLAGWGARQGLSQATPALHSPDSALPAGKWVCSAWYFPLGPGKPHIHQTHCHHPNAVPYTGTPSVPLSHCVGVTLRDVTEQEPESLRPAAPLDSRGRAREGFFLRRSPAEHAGRCCT